MSEQEKDRFSGEDENEVEAHRRESNMSEDQKASQDDESSDDFEAHRRSSV